MKHLIKMLSLGILVLGMANCGKKGGGAPAPAAPISNAAHEADQIELKDGDSSLIWSDSKKNFYVTTQSGTCSDAYIGLSSSADDSVYAGYTKQLSELVNSSLVIRGTQKQASDQSVYLSIKYKSGETRTFNLTTEYASSDEETLSNGSKIIDLFMEVNTEIELNGTQSCFTGK